MNERKKGYHITPKSNLYSIQKNGLLPRVGRRSYSVDESDKAVSFTDNLSAILIWKERFFGDTPIDDFAILIFDLDGIQWEKKFCYASVADFYTVESIPPEMIRVIQITKKDMPQDIVSLEFLREAICNKEDYQLVEQQITELFLEEPIINADKIREIIESLADYEHKKWSEDYNRIEWKGRKNKDGSLEMSAEDVEQMQRYINLDYEQSDNSYKIDINKAVMESFLIMQENNMISSLGMSEEELIFILEHVEYMRKNRWNQYLLSVCSKVNGKYIIPAEKVKLWKAESRTPYEALTEREKESDKREVNNIFLAIEQSSMCKQKIVSLLKKRTKESGNQDIGE